MKKKILLSLFLGFIFTINAYASKNWETVYIDTTTGTGINVNMRGGTLAVRPSTGSVEGVEVSSWTINMNTLKIIDMGDPAAAQDAATKNYVDITAILDSLGTAAGQILYYNGANWVALSSGTAGYILTTGETPSWTAASAGDVTEAGDNEFTGYNTHTGSSVWTGGNGEVVTDYGFFHASTDTASHHGTFTVGDPDVDSNWHDWDLSGVDVPTNAKAVLIAGIITEAGVGGKSAQFRENGYTGTSISILRHQVAGIAVNSDMIVPCDAGQIIEYKITTGTDLTQVTVKGWWK